MGGWSECIKLPQVRKIFRTPLNPIQKSVLDIVPLISLIQIVAMLVLIFNCIPN